MGILDFLFGPKGGARLPEYKRDHQIPERRLVHGFLALYTADDGDPCHTMSKTDNIAHLVEGWGLDSPAELLDLMERYETGECNPAFDLARAIKLARHGSGAGWISDEESWRRCIGYAERLKGLYKTWADVYMDFQKGREQWWTQIKGEPVPEGQMERYAQAYSMGNHLIYSKMPLND